MGSSEMITINTRIQLPARVIEAVVKNAKQKAGADEKGVFRVDTAETLYKLINNFLKANHFDEYADDIQNY